MADFERARRAMVDNQLRTSNVSDWRILASMGKLPRERFVPPARRDLAYIDEEHWFGSSGQRRFMAPPAELAKLIQLAEIGQDDRVLVVGATTGYSIAVIADMAAHVVGLEPDEALVATGTGVLAELHVGNARLLAGTIDTLARQSFDVILFEGALSAVPTEYFPFLADNGRLVAAIGSAGLAVANVFVRAGQNVTARQEFAVALPILSAPPAEMPFIF